MILKSLKSGFVQMWANRRMVLIFYFANLLFGLLVMLPFRAILNKFAGHSLLSTKLGGLMDMDFLFEFIKHNSSALSMLTALLLMVSVVYWLFALFLSGGAFAVFATGEKYSSTLFWGSAAKYFGRFIRLVLLSVPVFVLLFCLQFLESAIERILFGSDPYQYISYWGRWIKLGLRYISILLFGLVLDYARIHVIVMDQLKMRISLWKGIKFAFKNFSRTFGLAFLLFFIGVVALVIYNPLANVLSAPKTFVVIMLFMLQQLYLFFRMMLRLTLYSSQTHLYKTLSSEHEPATLTTMDDIGVQV